MRLVRGQSGVQVGEIRFQRLAVEAAGGDIGKTRWLGDDPHQCPLDCGPDRNPDQLVKMLTRAAAAVKRLETL